MNGLDCSIAPTAREPPWSLPFLYYRQRERGGGDVEYRLSMPRFLWPCVAIALPLCWQLIGRVVAVGSGAFFHRRDSYIRLLVWASLACLIEGGET